MHSNGHQALLKYVQIQEILKQLRGLSADSELPIDVETELRDMIFGLIATIFLCDGDMTKAECSFLTDFFHTKYGPKRLLEMMEFAAGRWNQIRYELPEFLVGAAAFDRKNQTSYAEQILQAIYQIGVWAAHADSHRAHNEDEVLNKYCLLLAADLQARGVGVTALEVADANPTQTLRQQPAPVQQGDGSLN